MNEEDLDLIAQRIYGVPFSSLSVWGQQKLQRLSGVAKPKINAPYNVSMDNVSQPLMIDNERLAKRVEDLEQENHELFVENGELKNELARIQGQI